MSKERKFHELIEQQSREEKDRVWAKIKQADVNNVPEVQESHKKFISWQKIVFACVASIVVMASVFLVPYLLPKNITIDNSSGDSSSSGILEETRYCDSNMYTLTSLDKTFKQLGNGLLYLDWYDITDYYATSVYRLKDTTEDIGFYEEIIDVNTGSLIALHNIYSGYNLESLQMYASTNQVVEINGIDINWGYTVKYSYANFEYGEYKCFVVVEYPMSEDCILDILNELLS